MREELELSGVSFEGSHHKWGINKTDTGLCVALTGSGELPVNDSMLTSCPCTCIQTFPCLGACCFCLDHQHLSPSITLSNFLSSVSRGAGAQLMISATNGPGHSCGEQRGQNNTGSCLWKTPLGSVHKENQEGCCERSKKWRVHNQEKTQVRDKELKGPEGWPSPSGEVVVTLQVIFR